MKAMPYARGIAVDDLAAISRIISAGYLILS